MKIKFLPVMAAALIAVASCSEDNNSTIENRSGMDAMLEQAVNAYVDHTVLPTYKGMADAAVELADRCADIQARHAEGTLTQSDIIAAGEVWKASRRYWELSEAFLYGPATNHNIDPHIDSWPLDKVSMDNLLASIRAQQSWSLYNNGGYGLLGFHALEYMLYELTPDENSSLPHSTSYTAEELVYMVAVAEDLRDQCVCLEACWAGTENISAEKQQILEDAELDYGENYGWEMKNSGKPGSHFITFQDAAEEILQGCIDIADEVGTQKIGRPGMGASEEDKDYIESPYSLNSIEDFADNIRSIRNAYYGSVEGDASVSACIAVIDADLDARVRAQIDATIAAIELIPEPFAKNATSEVARAAMTSCAVDLTGVLEEAYDALTRY